MVCSQTMSLASLPQDEAHQLGWYILQHMLLLACSARVKHRLLTMGLVTKPISVQTVLAPSKAHRGSLRQQ